MVKSAGIPLKKRYGQHFLRNRKITLDMIEAVELNDSSSVFEIGCGDGFLTETILQNKLARLWVFEIDREWVDCVQQKITDKRLTIFHENFLDIDWEPLKKHAPWTVLANLPYQVTFPIFHRFQEHRDLIKEGVVMIQEEVAQKIVKKSGRGYGFISLFFQYYFELKMLTKVPPSDFYPPPAVDSRLLYFRPKKALKPIPNEEDFWKFIKQCFKQPRRTMRNNLKQAHFDIGVISEDILKLRAQQMSMEDFTALWVAIR